MATAEAAKAEHWPVDLETYHSDAPASISHSELDTFIASPRLYYERFVTKRFQRAATKVLDFGQIVHDIVLGEPCVIHQDNFRDSTVAIFQPAEPPTIPTSIVIDPDVDVFWFSDSGVYRQSRHWGPVRDCFWHYAGDEAGDVCGFCPWSQFMRNESFVPIPWDVLSSDGARKGKAWKDFAEQHDGKVLLKPDEFGPLPHMLNGLYRNSAAKAILERAGECEHSIRWESSETGLTLRARLDKFCPGVLIADLKSIRGGGTHPKAFSAAAATYGYHRQAAWYQDAARELAGDVLPFVFIVVEKEPPYCCEVFELDADFVSAGRFENEQALRRLLVCRESDCWETETHGQIVKVAAPAWKRFEDEWNYEGNE